MWLVVGLGNPGDRYRGTRHNVGFAVVDLLGERWDSPCDRPRPGALWADVRRRNDRIHLLKPQEYMNLSGLPTRRHMDYFKLDLDQVIVVHDDLDLPFGTLRIKRGGGHGGHNGLRDLDRHLPSPDYVRIRFGIGRPPRGQEVSSYVLARWRAEEAEALPELLSNAAGATQSVISRGLSQAMNRYNRRPKKKKQVEAESGPPTSPSENSNEAPPEAAS